MGQGSRSQRLLRAPAASAQEQAGCYIYCIAPAGQEATLVESGIEGSPVYAVAHDGLCALVHDCPPQPYQPPDAERAAAYVLAHHRVVEAAWKRWGTVLPLTFNTVIAAGESSARENLVAWLDAEHKSLQAKLKALARKAEYGVHVFYDAALIGSRLAEAGPEIRKLEEEIRSRSRGLAYMYRQKLEGLLKREMEAWAAEASREVCGRLSRCADDIRVEKVKGGVEGQHMLLNLSCLVSPEKYPDLKAEVSRISNMEGYSARIAGPLPPYSFC